MRTQSSTNLTPVVSLHGGKATTNSRDVADLFGKRHADVLRAIDALISEAPATERNFASSSYVDGSGRSLRSFDIDRDGFTLLSMGFTGSAALQFKMAYIDAFNKMEQQLAGVPEFNIPQTLPDALQLAADLARQLEQKEAAIGLLTPKAAALDLIANNDGTLNLTETAKLLGVKLKGLIVDLHATRWIYRRPGARSWLGYADREQAGVLTHKQTSIERADGSEKIAAQARITPKGLTKLAERYAAQPGELFQ